MLYDLKNLYSNQQTLSTSAAAHVITSDNIIDHGPLATGNTSHHLDRANLFLNLRITTAFVSTGAGTMAVTFVTADNTALTGSAVVFTAVPAAVVTDSFTAGAEYAIPLPRGTYKRYSAIKFTGATHIITAGAALAVLTDEPGRYTAFAQDAQVYGT